MPIFENSTEENIEAKAMIADNETAQDTLAEFSLDVHEASEILGISLARLSQITGKGSLSYLRKRVGTRWRIFYKRCEIENYLAQQTLPPVQRTAAPLAVGRNLNGASSGNNLSQSTMGISQANYSVISDEPDNLKNSRMLGFKEPNDDLSALVNVTSANQNQTTMLSYLPPKPKVTPPIVSAQQDFELRLHAQVHEEMSERVNQIADKISILQDQFTKTFSHLANRLELQTHTTLNRLSKLCKPVENLVLSPHGKRDVSLPSVNNNNTKIKQQKRQCRSARNRQCLRLRMAK